MIYTTQKGESFDTEKDFTAAERHVLQKLFLWKDLVSDRQEFRQRKERALRQGWDNSGPIPESPALRAIARDLEELLARRPGA